MKHLLRYYSLTAEKISCLRSPFLLAVRLYWGWQFRSDRLGKSTTSGRSRASS